jgi:hypothetical protein
LLGNSNGTKLMAFSPTSISTVIQTNFRRMRRSSILNTVGNEIQSLKTKIWCQQWTVLKPTTVLVCAHKNYSTKRSNKVSNYSPLSNIPKMNRPLVILVVIVSLLYMASAIDLSDKDSMDTMDQMSLTKTKRKILMKSWRTMVRGCSWDRVKHAEMESVAGRNPIAKSKLLMYLLVLKWGWSIQIIVHNISGAAARYEMSPRLISLAGTADDVRSWVLQGWIKLQETKPLKIDNRHLYCLTLIALLKLINGLFSRAQANAMHTRTRCRRCCLNC